MKLISPPRDLPSCLQTTLYFLNANGPASVAQMMKHLKLSPSATWRRLSTLADKGLIERTNSTETALGRPKLIWRAVEK